MFVSAARALGSELVFRATAAFLRANRDAVRHARGVRRLLVRCRGGPPRTFERVDAVLLGRVDRADRGWRAALRAGGRVIVGRSSGVFRDVAFSILNARAVETPCDGKEDAKDARYRDKRLSRPAQDSHGKQNPTAPQAATI